MPRDSTPSGWSPISPLLLLSLLVSCISAAVAVYAWTHLVSGQREHLQANLSGIARHCSDALERRAWSQTVALGDLAHTWSAFAPKPEAEWQHEASSLLKQHPSIREVLWTNGGQERRLGEGDVALLPESDTALRDAEAKVRAGTPRALVSPVRFTDGRYGFVVFMGAPGAGQDQAVLRATFDYGAFAARALEDRVNGYAFTLWNGDVPVAQGSETPAPGLDWWRASETAAHPIGAEWRVELRPTAAIARQELSILPHVLLATGLLAAAMIGALVWTSRVAARRARTMAVADAAMREIAERAKPEQAPRADGASGGESTVLERAEELREAVLDLEAFNVSVSHDLRSPIGAIVNLTAVLRETNPQLDPASLDLVNRIDRSALRALARMDALLDFSRLGRRPLRRELVDLHRLAWRISRELAQAPPGERAEFVLGSVPNALGDAAMLEALLRNLLDNAVKFSRGEEKPRVEFGVLPGEGDAPIYFVRDNGVGFDPKYADKVFGLFERQHHASEFEGTGVGLAIVSRIVRRHGGRVWAEGELGAGATFYFTLGPGQ